MWSRLSSEKQAQLLARHRQIYARLSEHLYIKDTQNPSETRVLAQAELRNLLFAVDGALDVGEEQVVDFVDCLSRFLCIFGLIRDQAILVQRVEQGFGEVGFNRWYLTRIHKGERLRRAGCYPEAVQVFNQILVGLGEQPSYERCVTLGCLGQCLQAQGQAKQAVALYHQALAVAQQLEMSDNVKGNMSTLQTQLAELLTDIGEYDQARTASEQALALKKEIGDTRGKADVKLHLGYLAFRQGNLLEAEQLLRKSLITFQELKDPAREALAGHRLGMVYEQTKQWDAAEQVYREAGQIRESLGNLHAASTWHQLALVKEYAGNLEEAEAWYSKAIEAMKSAGDCLLASTSLSTLANLLRNQPNRLPEARLLAEEALAIKQKLDPAATEIWNTYEILADIANKQGDTNQAMEYRRLLLHATAACPGTWYQFKELGQCIAGVVAAVNNAEVREHLEPALEEWTQAGWGHLVAAIREILKGERDEDVLCESLDMYDSMIIYAIIRGIADPETLKLLL